MNCITIDENPLSLIALHQMIEQLDFLHLSGEFTNAIEAINFIKKYETDLIFLDIELPDLTGLDLIDSLDNPPLIIVVSSKKEYAVQAFEKHVADYLVKPVTLPRFLDAVNFAQKIYMSNQPGIENKDTIFVKADGRWNRLNLSKIKYLQARGDYVRFFTEEGRLMVNKTMKSVIKKLPEKKFVRVHRSYIVNIDHIVNIEENKIQVGKDLIPVSERYKMAFMKHLNLL